jgi:hypothetical protein
VTRAAASAVQVYNTILKVVFLSTSYATIYLIRNQYKHTYDKENDTFRMIFLVVPCFVTACFVNYYPNPQEVSCSLRQQPPRGPTVHRLSRL